MANNVTHNAHPLYSAMLATWEKNRDCYEGEEVVKSKGSRYLPATSGMIQDGFGSTNPHALGNEVYAAYRTRAYFADLMRDAVETAIGVMHREPPIIQLPPRMEVLRDNATYNGEPLHILLRQINEQQLVTGRVGLLGDFRADDQTENAQIPVLALYYGEAIFNWDDLLEDRSDSSLRFVALDESDYEMQGDFEWKHVPRVRVLGLADESGKLTIPLSEHDTEAQTANYSSAELRNGASLSGITLTSAELQGEKLNRIPFTFINAKDLNPSPDYPPLDGLCNLALAIYRGEADYRQQLFMQGQDTLVVIGTQSDDDKPLRTGAGARIDLPVNGDAKFIGVESQGLSEQRQALETDYERAQSKTAKLVNADGNESGEALRLRLAAQTATLPQIAMAGAAGLQKVLRDLAVWFGENPQDVVVTPNLEFAATLGNAQSLVQLVQAKMQGAPISDESIHAWMQENGFTKLDYKEELGKIDAEGVTGGNNNSNIPARSGAAQGGNEQDNSNNEEEVD